jgi:hypothetical protein
MPHMLSFPHRLGLCLDAEPGASSCDVAHVLYGFLRRMRGTANSTLPRRGANVSRTNRGSKWLESSPAVAIWRLGSAAAEGWIFSLELATDALQSTIARTRCASQYARHKGTR